MRFIPLVGLKLNPKGNGVVTKAKHVLRLPLTISTRRVELIISKDTVSDEVLVLAKSRSKEGSRKPEDLTLKSNKEWLFFKNTLLEKNGLKASKVRVSP